MPAANGPIPQKQPPMQPPPQPPMQQPITLMQVSIQRLNHSILYLHTTHQSSLTTKTNKHFQLLNSQLKNQPVAPQPPPHQPHPANEPLQMPAFNHVGPLGPVQHPHQSQMQHENLMKVLQIQQQQQMQQQQQQQKQRQQQQQQQSEMLSMMMGGGPQSQQPQQPALPPPQQPPQQPSQRMISPIPADVQMMINSTPSSRDLLQRPEAEALIRGLQQGEITKQHLVQQLQVRISFWTIKFYGIDGMIKFDDFFLESCNAKPTSRSLG